MRPRGLFRPSSSASSRRRPELAAVALAVAASGCASARLPAPAVVAEARAAASWSGSLRVSVEGDSLRGGSRALVAFRRPDALRIEIPGPAGARLVAVARDGRLHAVLGADRARLESRATAGELDALIGVSLTPGELMDLLVGSAPPGARTYRADWGDTLPRRVRAELLDSTRLDLRIDEADANVELPDAAFDPPRCDNCRLVDADEARRLLTAR